MRGEGGMHGEGGSCVVVVGVCMAGGMYDRGGIGSGYVRRRACTVVGGGG